MSEGLFLLHMLRGLIRGILPSHKPLLLPFATGVGYIVT